MEWEEHERYQNSSASIKSQSSQAGQQGKHNFFFLTTQVHFIPSLRFSASSSSSTSSALLFLGGGGGGGACCRCWLLVLLPPLLAVLLLLLLLALELRCLLPAPSSSDRPSSCSRGALPAITICCQGHVPAALQLEGHNCSPCTCRA